MDKKSWWWFGLLKVGEVVGVVLIFWLVPMLGRLILAFDPPPYPLPWPVIFLIGLIGLLAIAALSVIGIFLFYAIPNSLTALFRLNTHWAKKLSGEGR